MTRDEMDAAIALALGWEANVAVAGDSNRRIFIAWMRAAADIAAEADRMRLAIRIDDIANELERADHAPR